MLLGGDAAIGGKWPTPDKDEHYTYAALKYRILASLGAMAGIRAINDNGRIFSKSDAYRRRKHMAVPTSKAELLAAITTTFEKLIADLAKVPPNRATEATMKGHADGTTMSPADLVAYLIGWNELVLKWLDRDDQNEPVDYPEVGFKWNQLGLLAQKFYADYNTLKWHERLTRLEDAKAGLIATITARSDEELYGSAWYGKWTKGRMIQFNSSSAYANARVRIRAWQKAKG